AWGYEWKPWSLISVHLKCKARLREYAVQPYLVGPPLVAVLHLQSRETRDIVPYSQDRSRQARYPRKDRIRPRNVNILEPVIRLPQRRDPRQPVSALHIPCLAVEFGGTPDQRFV